MGETALSVGFTAMGDALNRNNTHPVCDDVEDAIPAEPNAVGVGSPGQLETALRARVVSEGTNDPDGALTLLRSRKGLEFLCGGGLDDDLIAFHGA